MYFAELLRVFLAPSYVMSSRQGCIGRGKLLLRGVARGKEGCSQGGVDDWDKAALFVVGATASR
jgi:hypothetical protein